MLFLNRRKSKIKKLFNLEDEIDLSHGKFSYSINYRTLIHYIEQTNNLWDSKTIGELIAFILEQDLNIKSKENPTLLKSISDEHSNLISSGVMDIWNNEVFYHNKNLIAISEVVSVVLDKFTKNNPVFSGTDLVSIKLYLGFKIELNQVSYKQLHDDYFKQYVRNVEVFKTYQFFKDLSFSYYNQFLDANKDYSKYDFKISFESNMKKVIVNYNEFKENMKSKPLPVLSKNNPNNKIEINVGKYIDFKSLYSLALFVNVPEYKDDFIISISKKVNTESVDDLFLTVYDINNRSDASIDDYSKIINFLSN